MSSRDDDAFIDANKLDEQDLSTWPQIKALMEKNWILKKREKKKLILELLLPVLVGYILKTICDAYAKKKHP